LALAHAVLEAIAGKLMNKKTHAKLALRREVLLPLQTIALDGVAGGILVAEPTVGRATRACGGTQFYCVPKTGTLTG
jgi:hypothetical protein